MDFFVQISIDLPDDMPEDRQKALLADETKRGRELMDAGVLAAIWRVPGRTANISLYRVADTDALHDAITSLPLSPWMSVDVQPLATHPLADGMSTLVMSVGER